MGQMAYRTIDRLTGTVYALIQKLVDVHPIEEVYLGVSHNLCLEKAKGRLIDLHENCHLKELIVTNSIPQTKAFHLPFVSVRNLASILAFAINRVHYSRSLESAVLHLG